jgi:hypothetical protein
MARAFSSSTHRIDLLPRRDVLLLALAVLIGAAVYLIASKLTYAIGFPLDDSWIHQTYARNLGLHGEWAFRPGVPSAGSTAPLWSALLAIGFFLRLSPYIWTYLLGALCLFALALTGERAARSLSPSYRPRFPWVGLFFVFEWHLLWAAMSGMETLLHALILTVVLTGLMTGSRRYLALGLLTGLSVWVRPDGLTLLGPVILTILLNEKDMRARLRGLGHFLIGFGALFLLYLLFNLVLGGTPMPNTFYAKQAEYAAWQARPLLGRLGEMSLQLLIGPSIFLLPGTIAWAVVSIKRRAWGTLACMLWAVGYLGLYVSRLPVYQHGRYIMPAMPVLLLCGLLALIEFCPPLTNARYKRLACLAWQASVLFTSIGFIWLGAVSYSRDVALIESEMVVTAKWAAQNIPGGSVIAAHDIGALGYFDDHELLDLAGLISPEVVPFIRDEARLAEFLNARGADYLIAFPEFYPQLVLEAEPVFSTRGDFAPEFNADNMVIYRWKNP